MKPQSSGLCSRDLPAIAELVDCADDCIVLDNPYHVLQNSMPNETVYYYALRRKPHNRELINITTVEYSFVVRNCFIKPSTSNLTITDYYTFTIRPIIFFIILDCVTLRFVKGLLNEYMI